MNGLREFMSLTHDVSLSCSVTVENQELRLVTDMMLNWSIGCHFSVGGSKNTVAVLVTSVTIFSRCWLRPCMHDKCRHDVNMEKHCFVFAASRGSLETTCLGFYSTLATFVYFI